MARPSDFSSDFLVCPNSSHWSCKKKLTNRSLSVWCLALVIQWYRNVGMLQSNKSNVPVWANEGLVHTSCADFIMGSGAEADPKGKNFRRFLQRAFSAFSEHFQNILQFSEIMLLIISPAAVHSTSVRFIFIYHICSYIEACC